MRDVLPAEVLRQPKAGFAAPVDYWLAHDLREMVDDLLSETNIRSEVCSARKRYAASWTSTGAEPKIGRCKSGSF